MPNIPGRSGGSHGQVQDPALAALVRAADPDNPIALMLASRSELKLVDSQTVVLRSMSAALIAQNGPLHQRLDSLRPPGDTVHSIDFIDLTSAERDSILRTRRAIAATLAELHDNAVHARTVALTLLTSDQQERLSDIEQRVANAAPQDTARTRGGRRRGGSRPPTTSPDGSRDGMSQPSFAKD